MNCPEFLILKAFNNRLWIYMYWRDVPRKTIPLKVWLNPLRYEVMIKFGFGKQVIINRGGYWNGTVSNVLYKYVRPYLCKWFGVHQPFRFRGGEKLCHHCNVGKDNDC